MQPTQNRILKKSDYKRCLRYIESYWDKITFHYPKDKFTHFGLPNRFVSPNNEIYRYDQFYWDSYFIIAGLVRCGRAELARGMVDNFLYMQKRFDIIPMRNRYYNLGCSQIPFLTSMANEVNSVIRDKRWLKRVMRAAEYELNDYWMNEKRTEKHLVFEGLSRYCDHYITHLAAEHESGWDMTSRFHNHCLDYLPVDLNCALYKYETDLAEFFKNTGSRKKHNQYILQSEKRRKKMYDLMWNFRQGFFFDYNYRLKRQGNFYSIAGFYPLWAKLATHTQARKLADNIKRFEHKGGLANTQAAALSPEYKQHDYPNGWPHQQWIVIKGLMNYGFRETAFRLTNKFLDLNKKIFEQTGKMWEKYDVAKGTVGSSERYPTQHGFGWTNAVFIRLLDKFSKA